MQLLIAHSAFDDLEAIKSYYQESGVAHVGDKFVREIIAHIETLSDHPEIGRMVPEFADPKLRELIHPPFRIVYLLESQVLHIIRVWRSERLLELPQLNY